jgi:hypothetical protein
MSNGVDNDAVGNDNQDPIGDRFDDRTTVVLMKMVGHKKSFCLCGEIFFIVAFFDSKIIC